MSDPLDREIDFDFYFDSFVRGEAKLRERVRGVSLSLGLPVGSCTVPPGLVAEGFGAIVAAIHVGFN